MPQPAPDGSPPVTFGKYRLLRRLARGGMGEVFLATLPGALGFEKTLVVKTILPELASRERFVDLFAAEAKTAVALTHGNIVPIYELGQQGDTLYIAMGYVDGPPLSDLLRAHRRSKTPLELPAALFIARQILTGMAYAHTAEPGRPPVVHRDLSPRNVLLDRSGQVRIVDFGIAMPAHAAVDARMGSVGYVAPEQARAEAPDPRADVFSVGCLLYELLTLERAFPREGVWVSPDLSRIPQELREPLRAALSLDPADRPTDAGAFLDQLAEPIRRHATTYSDRDMARHLRRVFPGGWRPDASSPAAPEGPEPTATPATAATAPTVATPATPAGTRTFATRLLAEPAPSPAEAPRRRRLTAAAILAGVALSFGAWIAWSGVTSEDEPSPTPPPREEVIAAPSFEPAPANAPHRPADAAPTAPRAADGPQTPGSGAPAQVTQAPTVAPSPPTPPPKTPQPGPATPAPPARLTILTPTLPWAEVYIDGKKVAHTPLLRHELPAGRHRVRVRCHPDICTPERDLHDRKIELTPGKTRTLRLR